MQPNCRRSRRQSQIADGAEFADVAHGAEFADRVEFASRVEFSDQQAAGATFADRAEPHEPHLQTELTSPL
jgi:hypothetical protein